jgi:lysozyme family protein
MADAKKLMPFILKWEGGYVNDKDDRGGATNKGVTLNTFKFYYPGKGIEDLKHITDDEWLHIFKAGYWNRWQADKIKSQSVANILVDWVWASGKYGITIPQAELGLKADGIVGDKTIERVNSLEPKMLFNDIKNMRIGYINRIVSTHP